MEAVDVAGGALVLVGAVVAVGGTGESVGMEVEVGMEGAAVFVFGTKVTPGVLVGTFGTQSLCPTYMMVDEPMQLERCSCATVVLYRSEMR